MVFHRTKFLGLTMSLALLCFTAAPAEAKIIMELFGVNSCEKDDLIQQDIERILKENDDIIFLNCRTPASIANGSNLYTHDFCKTNMRAYTKSFGGFASGHVVINGRWDANNQDIMPAVRLGRLDPVEDITLSRNNGNLEITVPEIAGKSGVLHVYVYLPTTRDESFVVENFDDLDDEAYTMLQAGQKVDNIQRVQNTQFMLRPIFSREYLGAYSGQEMQLSVPMKDLVMLTDKISEDLGFVVTLHEGSETSTAVLAVGETMPIKEKAQALPSSKGDLDIQFRTAPSEEGIN